LGCFLSLKAAYRRFVGEHTASTDKTKLGKAKFLQFYAEARKIGLREQCIRSGWKATGLYPKNVKKPLGSRWVVVRERPSTPPPSTMDINTPKRGSDIVKLFSGKKCSPNTRRCVRRTAAAFDRTSMMVTMQDREIASLREQVEQANPPKRRKVATNPNDIFASLAEVLSQTNREPSQRVRKARSTEQQVIIVEEESSSEEAEQPLVRRSTRNRQPTRRYLDCN
jgi:4-hydroxybenzoate polyprenyltransferase